MAVSAQQVGLTATQTADPARYAALSHPGDSYSYDIYSQAGQAVRFDADTLLDGLQPERVLAVGESQSAGRLLTYVNAVHPLAGVFDGFLVHSRFGAGAALSQDPLPQVDAPTPTLLREDLDVPVLVFQTETDDRPRCRPVSTTATSTGCGRSPARRTSTCTACPPGPPTPATRRAPSPGSTPCWRPAPTRSRSSPARCRSTPARRRSCCAPRSPRWTTGSRTGTPPPSAPRLETVEHRSGRPEYAVDERGHRPRRHPHPRRRRPGRPASAGSASRRAPRPAAAVLPPVRHDRPLRPRGADRALRRPRRLRAGVAGVGPTGGRGRLPAPGGRRADGGRRRAGGHPG